MPRYGTNSDRKTTGLNNTRGGDTPLNSNIDLPAEQLAEVERLRNELNEVRQYKNKVSQKLSKLNQIIVNFDQVIAGDIIINILPDTSLEEIYNSPILSYREIIAAIDNQIEVLNLISKCKIEISKIFGSSRLEAIRRGTDELRPEEMYSTILKAEIQALPRGNDYTTIKTELNNIILLLESELI
jgi:hypothetical protein